MIGRDRLHQKFAIQKPDIVVALFGINDLKSIKDGKKWYKFGTAQWNKAYQKKIFGLLRLLRKQNISVYWVGLPIMRGPKTNSKVVAYQ